MSGCLSTGPESLVPEAAPSALVLGDGEVTECTWSYTTQSVLLEIPARVRAPILLQGNSSLAVKWCGKVSIGS